VGTRPEVWVVQSESNPASYRATLKGEERTSCRTLCLWGLEGFRTVSVGGKLLSFRNAEPSSEWGCTLRKAV